jgi:hypothetical protein
MLVAMAGCGVASADEVTDKPKPSKAKPTRLEIAWSNITLGEPGCFYFSGPEGRDDKLAGTALVERNSGGITITVGKAVFRGAVDGSVITLTRQSTHDHDGPWLVKESIKGTLVEGGIRARYHYEECELAANECPGPCTVDADLALRP